MPDDADKTALALEVPDWLHETTVARMLENAAYIFLRRGFDTRIDIYRDVTLQDSVTLGAFGKPHPVRVRLKITACSILWKGAQEKRGKGGD